MTFHITGVRHIIAKDITNKEEQNMVTRAFIEKMQKGEMIILKKEPDNCVDPNAIAAYYKYQKIGYIPHGEVVAANTFMGQYDSAEAEYIGSDGHITIEISVRGAEKIYLSIAHKDAIRKLPPQLFIENVYLSRTDEVQQFEMLAQRIIESEGNAISQRDWIDMAKIIEKVYNVSISREQIAKQADVLDIITRVSNTWENDTEEKRIIKEVIYKLQGKQGDLHRRGGYAEIYKKLKESCSVIAKERGNLYEKYDAIYWEGVFNKASESDLSKEEQRLKQWITSLPNDIGRYYLNGNDSRAAEKINYADLSEMELCEVIAAFLVYERVCKRLYPIDEQNESTYMPNVRYEEWYTDKADTKERARIDKKIADMCQNETGEHVCMYLADRMREGLMVFERKGSTVNVSAIHNILTRHYDYKKSRQTLSAKPF